MAYILDDSYTSAVNGTLNERYLSTTVENAVAFVPTTTAPIGKITLKLIQNGTIAAGKLIWVKIYSDNSGTPNAVLATSGNVAADGIAGSATDYDFIFDGTVNLTAGVTYWASLAGDYTVSTTNYIGISARTPSYRTDSLQYTPWAVAGTGYSMYFKEYYVSGAGDFKFL